MVIRYGFLTLLALGAMLTASAAPETAQPPELVNDGGFEAGSLKDWRFYPRNFQPGWHNIANATEYGKNCLVLSGSPEGKVLEAALRLPQLKQGKEYLLRFRVRAQVADPAGKAVEFCVLQEIAKGGTLCRSGKKIDLGNSEWQAQEVRFGLHKRAERFNIYANLANLTPEDKVFFDDISLVESRESAPAPSPAPVAPDPAPRNDAAPAAVPTVAAAVPYTPVSSDVFSHDVQTAKKPWTHERFQNQDGEFSFIILPDRAGGERKKGIWFGALAKANLFHPDFIITVGDMVEGVTRPENLKQEIMEEQFAELQSVTAKSAAPFFYVVGNHDINRTEPAFPMLNEMGRKVWLDNLGTTYYSFIYKNVLFLCLDQQEGRDSRTPQCGLTEAQLNWALETLKQHPDVRWTLVFVHSPWTWNETPFHRLEKAMADRNYTVFAGDFHYYNKFRRHGRNYYLLATAGGCSEMRGIEGWGEFDHITYVTMTAQGPQVVNVLLDGILPDDVVTTEQSKQPKTPRVGDIPDAAEKE